jgi:hypothetical protein
MNPEDDPTIKAGRRIQNAVDELRMALDFLPSDHPIKQDLIELHHEAQKVSRDVHTVWVYRDGCWAQLGR